MNFSFTAAILFMCAGLAACSNANDQPVNQGPPNPFAGFESSVYRDGDNWLCHPALADADNVCSGNLDTTIVFADGSTEIEPHIRAENPAVDCFYVYPTSSDDPGINSDLEVGAAEVFVTLTQAARYSRFCRMFVPAYRQVTLAALTGGLDNFAEGQPVAYDDVVDSFKHYMANDNNGRGVILIGHSQGAAHLEQLIAETVETDEYLLQKLIAAHLMGVPVHTPEGADIGGDFQRVPVCRTSDQTGCVVNYSTYRDNDPQLAAGLAIFATPESGAPAICTNPAALSGGTASLSSYFPVADLPGLLGEITIKRVDGPFADPETAPQISTPFYAMPDFISGQCIMDANGINYLAATVHPDPLDPRADDFNGEFIGFVGWGLHLVDMTLPEGDLVDLGAAQAQAWLQDQ